MNGLSWLLYLADVSANIRGLFFMGLSVLGVIAVANIISLDTFLVSCEQKERWQRLLKSSIKAFVPFLIIFVLIPSKSTIYLIAASELGEHAINTDMAKKIESYLDATLANIIDGRE